MDVFTSPAETRAAVLAACAEGRTVGFVPTMGALHAGHLSLIDAARAECDLIAASIFVNPTQFAPSEDFSAYPRPLERDLDLLREHGCQLVFTPAAEVMYPPGAETSIDVGSVARPWEGAQRPTHFAGVATVVMKLFQIVPATHAYFGQKDYQQTVVVRRMVADLNVPIEVRVCPIVRAPDGLALSSRNAYLTPAQRQQAVALSQSLAVAREAYAGGERDAARIKQLACHHLAAAGLEPDYVAVMADGTVSEVDHIDGPSIIALAVRVGQTRLIDNCRIG